MLSDQDSRRAGPSRRRNALESRRARVVMMARGATTAEIAALWASARAVVRYWTRALNSAGRLSSRSVSASRTRPMERAKRSTGVTCRACPWNCAKGRMSPAIHGEAGRRRCSSIRADYERTRQPAGENIEGVHDMRVATRRMRSALRLFGPFFDREAIDPFRKDLRTIADALGTVRDLDVFKEKAERFMAARPEADLTPLLDGWEQRYARGRRKLIGTLDKGKYARFVARFHDFLTTPGAGALPLPEPGDTSAYLVRHVAPRLIYEHYEQVRAYEAVADSAAIPRYNALRIDFQAAALHAGVFRRGAWPRGAAGGQRDQGPWQDHLGDLNDAAVAETMLREFVDHHNETYSGVPLSCGPTSAVCWPTPRQRRGKAPPARDLP